MKHTTRLLSLLLVIVLCLSVLPMSAMADSGWQKIGDNWYYIENGGIVTGWKVIGGKTYFLDPSNDGAMYTGWRYDDYYETWFYFASSGAMAVNQWVKDTGSDGTVSWYYQLSDGSSAIGWQKIGGYWYYFAPETGGAMVSDYFLFDDDGYVYHFGSGGRMDTSKWVPVYYYDQDDNLVKGWYYFQSSGRAAQGWLKLGGIWYYFNPYSGGEMAVSGPWEINGRIFWFNSDGSLYTGWKKVPLYDDDGYYRGDFWLYFTSSGAAQGWKKIGGKWYYFKANMMVTGGPIEIGSGVYCFNSNGTMYTGWKDFGFGWMYFTSSGAAKKSGWLKIGGQWYRFEDYIWVE